MLHPTSQQARATPEGTRLAHFSAGLLEAIWLAALLIIPLLFNPYATAGFEPQKIIFIELLAVLLIVVSIIHVVETRKQPETGPEFSPIPKWLVGAFVLAAVCLMVSTAFSIVPSSSIWGDYEHRQNVVARLSLMVFGATVAWRLRTSAQIERLIAAAIAAAVPVAIYAFIQSAGADPLLQVDFNTGPQTPSLIGHEISLSSYLLLILPLCLWRAFVPSLETPPGADRTVLQKASLFYHRLVAVLILAAFLVTEKRGPLLGLLAGLVCFASLVALYRNQRRIVFLGFGLTGTCLVFLTVLSLPNSPLAPLRSIGIFNRFAHIVPPVPRIDSRDILWSEAWKLVSRSDSLTFPSGAEDRFPVLRPLLGYGPETIDRVLPLQFEGFGIMASADTRLHNIYWDLYFTTGALGLGTFLLLVLFVFFHAYRWLGFVTSRKDFWIFWGTTLVCGGVAALALAFAFHPGYLAVGLPFGLVAGLMVVPFVIRRSQLRSQAQLLNARAALVLALLAGSIGHLVETAFSWQAASPAVVWWLGLGMIVALARFRNTVPAPATSSQEISTVEVLANNHAPYVAGPASVLIASVLTFAFSRSSSTPVLVMIACATFLAVFVFTAASRGPWRKGELLVSLAISLAGSAIAYASISASLQWLKPGHQFDVGKGTILTAVMEAGALIEIVAFSFVALVFLLIVAMGFSLRKKAPLGSWGSSAGIGVSLVLVPVFAVIVWLAILPAYRADAWAWWGARLMPADTRASAVAYRRAIALSPTHLLYRMHLFEALLTATAPPTPVAERDALFAEAETILLGARAVTKLDGTAYELGCLYLRWALLQPDQTQRLDLGRKAAVMLEEALEFAPKSALIWAERALVDRLILGREDDAKEKMQKSNELSRKEIAARMEIAALWAAHYEQRAASTDVPELSAQYLLRTLHYLEFAVRRAKVEGASPYTFLVQIGTFRRNLGEYDLSIEAFHEALQSPSPNGPWQANAMLANIYLDQGKRNKAAKHAAEALRTAPPEMKPAIQQLLQDIVGTHPMFKPR